jgi:hypothetical protein
MAQDIAVARNREMPIDEVLHKYIRSPAIKDQEDMQRVLNFVETAYAGEHVNPEGTYNLTYRNCVQLSLHPHHRPLVPGAQGRQIES